MWRALVLSFGMLISCSTFISFNASPTFAFDAAENNPGDPAVTEAVDKARTALKSASDATWYDEANDDVRTLRMKPNSAPPKPPPAPVVGSGPTGDTAFRVFAWIMLGVVLLFIIWIIVRAILNREKEGINSTGKLQPVGKISNVSRLDQLPVNLEPDISDLLGRARWLTNQGRYSEAIVYFYAHVLVQLDQLQLIKLSKGKTNRQYLREVSAHTGLRPFFMQTMRTFEESFFGGHAPDDTKCRACIDRWPEFEQKLPKGAFV
jgi:hypothetical protein